MSKRSRRRFATSSEASKSSADGAVAPSSSKAIPPLTVRSRFRRMPLVAAIACLSAAIVYFINHQNAAPKMGVIEYSSDDPQARVVLEKDSQEFPIQQTAKCTMNVEPGHYDLKLVSPTEGLKLRPSFINMDPGGRAFVTVRYEAKEAAQPKVNK